jgi:hypothetical protein
MNPFRKAGASGSWVGGIQIAGQLGMKPSSSLEHTLESPHKAVCAGSGLGCHPVRETAKRILSNLWEWALAAKTGHCL